MANKPRILVVDDELGVRESLRMILQSHHDVVTVGSGESALDALPAFQPDIVFIDIKMPGMDGLEVLQRIKAHDPTIQVVMVTAYASLETLQQSLSDGAFEYLIKPFSRSEVEESARRALAQRRGESGAEGQVWRLVAKMRRLSLKAQQLEEAAQREALEESLRVTQLSLLREISRGILGQLDLEQLTQGITDSLKAALGYDDVSILLGVEPPPPGDRPTFVACPIQDGEHSLGVLVVDNHRSGRAIDPRERELLEMLTEQVAIAVRNSHLHEETQQWLRHTKTLLAVSQAAGSTLELAEVVRRTIKEMVRLLKADMGGAWLLSRARDQLIPLAGYHIPKALAEHYFRTPLLFRYPLHETAQRLEELICSSDSQADPRLDHPLAQLVPHKSVLVVPMRLKDEVIGGFAILWVRERHCFADEELRLVEGIARQAAVAIENAQLYEEAEQRRREAEVVAELTQAINASLNLETVLQRVAEGAQELCGSDLARIALRDPWSEGMVVRQRVGTRYQGYDTLRIEAGKGVGGHVLVTKRPFRTERYAEDPLVSRDYLEVACAEGVVTELAVPIRIGDCVEGILYVDNRSPRPFTDRDEAVLLRLADHAAVAIQNARLYQQAAERAEKLSALTALTRLITSAADSRQVFRAIAEAATALLAAKGARVWVNDPRHQVLRPEASFGSDPQFDQLMTDSVVIPYGSGVAGSIFESRAPEYIADVHQDPRWWDQRLATEGGVHAYAGIPLITGDRVMGVLSVFFRETRQFTQEGKELIGLLADQAVIAISKARLFEESERRRKAAESLADLGHLISQSLDPEEVGQQIADSVRRLLGAEISVLFRLEDDSGDLIALAVSGKLGPTQSRPLVLPRGTGLAAVALRERHPVTTPDLCRDPSIALSPEARTRIERSDCRAALVVPLLVKGRVTGALAVRDRAGRVFDAEEIRLAQAFADHAATALENAHLLWESRSRQARLEALLEVNRQLSRIQPLEAVLGRIAEECGHLLGADSVGIRLVEGNELVRTATWGEAKAAMPTPRLKIGESLSGMVAATGEPLMVRNPATDERLIPAHREAMGRLGFRGVIIVPVKAGDQVMGILSIHTRRSQGFSAEDVTVAMAFAAQAAIALENSRLVGELRRALEEVEASQQRIVGAERLRALGEMAGGIAHDFNNTLAVILGRARLLLEQTKDPELQRQLRVIETAAADAAQTVRRIQEFVRTKRARPFAAVDLNTVIEEVVEITRSRWKDEAQAKGISYDVSVETSPLPPVLGDASELREALTNIVCNALDAMPQGGRLTLSTRVDGERVSCVVTDTGSGMNEEVRQRVFDPFFTTKGERGTGLGLSVVYGIITRHGGELDVQSRVEQGSAFIIRLPVAREIPEASEPIPPRRPHRSANILIIDDEPEVREVLRDLLAEEGHTVVTCADGESGLTRLEEETFDLVMTDLAMPGLTGWQVASLAKRRTPAQPVALVTGFGDRIDPAEARGKGVDFLVEKPFKLDDIRTVVAQALAQPDLTKT